MMASLWVATFTILLLSVFVDADPPLSIGLSIYIRQNDYYGYWKSYTVYFDVSAFYQFQACLCNSSTASCCMDLDYHYLGGRYEATSIKQCGGYKESEVYVFQCYVTLSGRAAESIICKKLSNLPNSKQVYSLQIYADTNCATSCVNVQWHDSQIVQDVWYLSDYTYVYKGLCVSTTSTPPTTSFSSMKTQTKSLPGHTTRSTSVTPAEGSFSTQANTRDDDQSNDNTSLITGVVVTLVVVVIIIVVILLVIFWRKKRYSKPSVPSHHYVTSTGAISHNYEETPHGPGYVHGHGSSATNPYVITDDTESMTAASTDQQSSRAVVDSYVSAEEVIRKKRAAAQSSDIGNHGTEYSAIDEDRSYTVVSPENGPGNTYRDNQGPSGSSETPASATYTKLGEPVRNIQNPYDALQNPDEYSVAKSTPANSNTLAQNSLAGPTASPSSIHDTDISHNSTPPSQPTNRNAYGYEEVGVNTMSTPVVSNDYEESPTHASGDNKDGAEAPKESDYTNFPVKEPVAAKNEYAKLGEPMRNIQNPYDVMVNQEEDGPEESTSQAPPTLADDPYSLARPT